MKIDISIDMTPQELREFLGWPDVQAVQQQMLDRIREQVESGADGVDPMSMMRPFLTPNMQSMEAMQNAFWQAFAAPAAKSDKKKK